MSKEGKRAKVTLADVAREAGTSTAVVSYVVNDGPRGVAEATRQRVEAAIAKLGYQPNLIARALASSRSRTIGLIVPDIANAWFSLLAAHIEKAAAARGLVLLLGSSGHDPARELEQLSTLTGLQVDGIILAQSPRSGDGGNALSAVRVPIVRVHFADEREAGIPSAGVNNQQGAVEAVRHLLGHGHEHIACLAAPPGSGPLEDRVEGWRQAVSSGEGAESEWLFRTGYDRFSAYDYCSTLFAQKDRPRALFCVSDEIAMGALMAAAKHGINVPDQLSIIGFDDISEARMSAPPLSTMHQPVDEIAMAAVDLLLAVSPTRNLSEVIEPAEHRMLRARLVTRGSCGCQTS